jgi:hypothetical protein
LTSDNELLNVALEYTARSWAVLPLLRNGKVPANAHGFYDAVTTESEVKEQFAKPTTNIGIRVGLDSNLIVIDPDDKGGKEGSARLAELERRLGPLPPTRTIETRYGKHYYFTFPDKWHDRLIKSEYAPGLDIKAKGYVVAPPSTVDGFTYFVRNDAPMVELPDAWAIEAVKAAPDRDEWARVRPRGTASPMCEEHSISFDDVLDLPADGPHSEIIRERAKSPMAHENSWQLGADGIKLTHHGWDISALTTQLMKDSPNFDENMSALGLVRTLVDGLSEDELILLLHDCHSEYFVGSYSDSENKEKLSLEMFRNGTITRSRYEELVGHPVE